MLIDKNNKHIDFNNILEKSQIKIINLKLNRNLTDQ